MSEGLTRGGGGGCSNALFNIECTLFPPALSFSLQLCTLHLIFLPPSFPPSFLLLLLHFCSISALACGLQQVFGFHVTKHGYWSPLQGTPQLFIKVLRVVEEVIYYQPQAFGSPEWHSGLRHCISVLVGVTTDPGSIPGCITTSRHGHTIGPVSLGFGRGRPSL